MNFFVGSCILNRSFPFGLSCWPSEVNHAHACLIGAMMIRRWCLRCCYDSWKEWHRHQQYRWASATSLCIANCMRQRDQKLWVSRAAVSSKLVTVHSSSNKPRRALFSTGTRTTPLSSANFATQEPVALLS